MSKARPNSEEYPLGHERSSRKDSVAYSPFTPPMNAPALLRWLDEQPLFVEYEYECEYRFESGYNPSGLGTRHSRQHTGLVHVTSDYERTSRKSFDSQGDVAEAWADQKFPTHNIVETDYGPAAELYTLSSYQTGIDGPSIRGRGMTMRGRRQPERPGAAFKCRECGHTTSSFDPERSGSWSNEDSRRDDIKSHIKMRHGTSEFTESKTPVDNDEVVTYFRTTGSRTTESEKNYAAYQHLDGAGHIEHYSTIAAIRSRHGVVLTNSQDFAKGRARVTKPGDYHDRVDVPLSGIMEYLSSQGHGETVFDVTSVEEVEVETSSRYRSDYTRTWYLLRFDTGAAFAVVYDSTAKNHHEKRCGFYLPPEQAEAITADSFQTSLRPVEVSAFLQRNDDAEVIGSHEYSNAAGRGATGAYHDDDQLGDHVIRQGEWFFVPMGDDLSDALAEMGVDADADDERGIHLDARRLPTECDTCGASDFAYRADGVVECESCASLWFVESNRVDENPLGNHLPREVVEIEGMTFVRGMIRHNTRDHNAINLKEVWHLAVDNGRDGVVFDTSTPENTSGRSGPGSMMRVE